MGEKEWLVYCEGAILITFNHQRAMKYKVFVASSLLIILNSCYGCPPTLLQRECRDFFALPSREQAAEFRAYPVERQVDLYLCGMNREPPEIAYAAHIAEGGDKNVPYLLQRLKAEQLEITQTRIIDIFTVLAIKGHLRGRQDVVDQLEEVASQMKYAPVKLQAHRYIEEIKKNVE
jgi:hypothetical protein